MFLGSGPQSVLRGCEIKMVSVLAREVNLRAWVWGSRLQPSIRKPLSGTSRRALGGTQGISTVQVEHQEGEVQPRPASEIPGPKRWPLLGSVPSMTRHKAYDPERIHLLWEAYFQEYGRIFRLAFPGQQKPSVCIYHPADIEALLKATFSEPTKPIFETLGDIRNRNAFFNYGQAGIMVEQRKEWWRVRSQVQPHTAKVKNVAYYLAQMDQVAQEFIESWASQRDEKKELPDDFLDQMFKWAFESLSLVTFNKKLGCLEETEEARKMINAAHMVLQGVQELEIGVAQWWRWFDTPAYKRLRQAHDDILEHVKTAVIQAQDELESRDPDSDESLIEKLLLTPNLTYADVHAFLVDLIIAGIDTTSTTVIQVMLFLARHPEKQQKVQEELDQVLGDGTEVLTSQHLARLRYLKAAVKETLRMDAPVPATLRETNEDTVLAGYNVPKGWTVFIYFRKSGLMEEFFPRATEFLPERWLREDSMEAINPYASIPFGYGTRMCVGRRLSEQEIYVVLARMLHKYRLEWKYGDLNPKLNMILIPNKPLRFTLIERA